MRGPRSGHGETCRHTTTPEYNSYRGILDRCLNPNSTAFPHYGGRGITVCQRWQESFENFLADVGRRPAPRYSIDRINVNGNYEPTNCRWADDKTQASNKTTRRVIHAKGKSLSLSEWSKETGLPIGTIHWRLAQGWDADRAVTPNTEGAAA
ncbi:MAG TPA: hypothetical protein VHO25_08170 [Polyangiaceae bacterium]|nr:hypothetical protein [Polyangiaceae bacterium]